MFIGRGSMPTLQGFLPRLGIFQDVVQVVARLNSKNP